MYKRSSFAHNCFFWENKLFLFFLIVSSSLYFLCKKVLSSRGTSPAGQWPWGPGSNFLWCVIIKQGGLANVAGWFLFISAKKVFWVNWGKILLRQRHWLNRSCAVVGEAWFSIRFQWCFPNSLCLLAFLWDNCSLAPQFMFCDLAGGITANEMMKG